MRQRCKRTRSRYRPLGGSLNLDQFPRTVQRPDLVHERMHLTLHGLLARLAVGNARACDLEAALGPEEAAVGGLDRLHPVPHPAAHLLPAGADELDRVPAL